MSQENPDRLTEAQRNEIRKIVKEEQADSAPITRRDALKGGGLLGGLALLGGGAAGSASADLSASGEHLAVGGSLDVDESYRIAGRLYAGPESAKPADPGTDEQAVWWVTDAQAGYVMRKEYWTGSSWEVVGVETDSVNTDSLFPRRFIF